MFKPVARNRAESVGHLKSSQNERSRLLIVWCMGFYSGLSKISKRRALTRKRNVGSSTRKAEVMVPSCVGFVSVTSITIPSIRDRCFLLTILDIR